jgi:hypothetical protein
LSKKTPTPKYVIGIDLGTTNSVLPAEIPSPTPAARQRPAARHPQLTSPGEVRTKICCPPLPARSAGFPATASPFLGDAPTLVTGRLPKARRRECRPPGLSARSWLAPGVDRTSALLTVSRPEGVANLAREASRRPWSIRQARCQMPDAPFRRSRSWSPSPSFDAVARELTEAAQRRIRTSPFGEPRPPFTRISATPIGASASRRRLILVVDIGGAADFT